jgi:hypothetical protein
LGLLISFLVGQRALSKDHTEHKTGLQNMRGSKQDSLDAAANGASGDEEKGRAHEDSDKEKTEKGP